MPDMSQPLPSWLKVALKSLALLMRNAWGLVAQAVDLTGQAVRFDHFSLNLSNLHEMYTFFS